MNDVTAQGPDTVLPPATRTYEVPAPPARRRGNPWLRIGIAATIFVLFAGGSWVMSASRNGSGGGSLGSIGGRSAGTTDTGADSFSYYHDENVDPQSYSAQWARSRNRRGDLSDYDGPYDYSGYGLDGVTARSKHPARTDPLYQDVGAPQPDDVFDPSVLDGSYDPTGGLPVGMPDAQVGVPAAWTSTAYDPFGGYTNPYANRIRMSFGTAADSRTAWLDAPTP